MSARESDWPEDVTWLTPGQLDERRLAADYRTLDAGGHVPKTGCALAQVECYGVGHYRKPARRRKE